MNKFHPFLVNNAIIPVGDLLLGTSISRNYRFLRESDNWDRERLDKYREKMFRKMLLHAYSNVPYYNDQFRKRNL